ncbi:Rho family GTPase [Entamoeba marina]
MWDTAGQEDFDRIRNKAYADTDVFLVCYSVDDQNSYENVEVKWVPEVTHFCKEAKIILAATKVDRRKDKTCNCLASSKCQELANRVGAAGHMECSSKTGTNVKELFKLAIDVVKGQAEVKEKKQDGCYIV